jgi:tetratricopeptide (TPR) repeat protein
MQRLSLCVLLATLLLLAAAPSAQLGVRAESSNSGHASTSSAPSTGILLQRATSLLAAGSSAEALALFDEVLDRDPADHEALYKRATAHLALGKLEKAREDLESVLQFKEVDQVRCFPFAFDERVAVCLRSVVADAGIVYIGSSATGPYLCTYGHVRACETVPVSVHEGASV